MKNYEKLINKIENIKPTPAVFKITSNNNTRRYLGRSKSLNFKCLVPSPHIITDILDDDTLIHNLAEKNSYRFFSSTDRDIRINIQDTIDRSISEVKDDLIDIFLQVSPNVKPKLTGIFKKLRRIRHETFNKEQRDLLLNVWLYSKRNMKAIQSVTQTEEDIKHMNNVHGLLGIAANRLIKI